MEPNFCQGAFIRKKGKKMALYSASISLSRRESVPEFEGRKSEHYRCLIERNVCSRRSCDSHPYLRVFTITHKFHVFDSSIAPQN